MRRHTSERRNPKGGAILLGWSGWAAASAGALFLVWGYLDREGAPWYSDLAVLVLGIVVPLLFLVGLGGICMRMYVRSKAQVGWLGLIGFIISSAGAAGWLATGVVEAAKMYGRLGERNWSPSVVQECGFCLLQKLFLLLYSPLTWLLVGLSIVGLATIRGRVPRNWGFLLLALASFGWVYQLTDDQTGIVDIRSIHVMFGILFALCWMLLGYALWSRRTRQTKQSIRKV